MVFQIVAYFQEKRLQALENKAAVKIVAGTADMKIWGVEQWIKAFDGSVLNEGDEIRTGLDSRATLSLYNGSVIRLNSDTRIELTKLKSRNGQDEAAFILHSGELWIKRSSDKSIRTAFEVATSHLNAQSMGTIFNVLEKNKTESVRVMDGKVKVAVKVGDESQMRTVEEIEVVFGQEITIGNQEIADMQARKPIFLLALLSDNFRDTEWYKWNRKQDSVETETVAVSEDAQKQKTSQLAEIIADQQQKKTEEDQQIEEVKAVLTSPEILTPKENERTTKKGEVLISGTASSAAQKIEVTTYVGNKPESYILQKYAAGSGKWTYLAASGYGNLVAGNNKYSIVAIGKDGERSDPNEIEIFYDKPKEPADLSAPVVAEDYLNFETSEDSVLVNGKIGKGIVKVFVNDFVLTKYVPDSGAWGYYAKTQYGNLKEGENEYSVYGVDVDGNKTPVTKFKIAKKAKPAEEPQPAAEPASVPSL